MINKNLLWSTYFIAWRKIYIARIKHNKKCSVNSKKK